MKYNYNLYKNVSILGSFNKHYEFIKEDIETFARFGFNVIVPQVENIKSNNNGYVLFDSNEISNPKIIEKTFLESCLKSDAIYVCNIGGYLGKTVMFEIGYLLARGIEIYFREPPLDEILIQTMCSESNWGCNSSEKLSQLMITHNETFSSRDYFDECFERINGVSLK